MAISLAARAEAAGATRGFDYLRLILAAAVIAWHGVYLTGSDALFHEVVDGPLGPARALVLPMFFALSGYLVTGSLARSRTMSGFLTLRAIRLVPALAVEVLLSAFVLGPVFTRLDAGRYFASPDLYRYLLNVVGYIHYELPGLFAGNPRPRIVNLSLWTVPFELECYVVIATIGLLGLTRWPRLLAVAVLAGVVGVAGFYLVRNGGIGIVTVTLPGRVLVLGFLAGVAIAANARYLPWSGAWAAVAAVLAVALVSIPQAMALSVVPVAYLTVWLGLLEPPRIPVLMDGDYSYGMYVFAFPIQQAIAQYPALRPAGIAIPLTLGASLLYAGFSWHCVEKPALGRRRHVVAAVEAVVGRWAAVLRPRRG